MLSWWFWHFYRRTSGYSGAGTAECLAFFVDLVKGKKWKYHITVVKINFKIL